MAIGKLNNTMSKEELKIMLEEEVRTIKREEKRAAMVSFETNYVPSASIENNILLLETAISKTETMRKSC